MMNTTPLKGIFAATFTPLRPDGSIALDRVRPMVDRLVESGVGGLYVLGSTGEGMSLLREERRALAEAFVEAAAGRVPVLVNVGHESLAEAGDLAAHARDAGADAISAGSPVYYKPESVDTLVASMEQIVGGAPELPFYYYHIPHVTGVRLGMVEFLERGGERIPSLRGIKFTSPDVFEFQSCLEFCADRFEILWGFDEMLLSGLCAGARAAVGSTYNFAAPVYRRLLAAFDAGDLEEARRQQSLAQSLVRTFAPFGSRGAQKAIMTMTGVDCGPCRWPIPTLEPARAEQLRADLEAIGFFEWIDRDRSSEKAKGRVTVA